MSDAEFIEHVQSEDKHFITDIWFNKKTGKYTSIVTDLNIGGGYKELDDIRKAIHTFYGGVK